MVTSIFSNQGADKYKRLLRLFLFAAAVLMVCSCATRSPKYQSATEIRLVLDGLYQRYLTNDINAAKRDMEISINILLSNTNNPKIDVTAGLWLAYARLYVIEDKIGNTNQATQLFNAARFWYIEEQKSRLKHEAYSVERMNRTIELFTEKKCKDSVEEWDKTFTKGNGAVYMKQH